MSLKIVTDSTADIPAALVTSLDITVVPVYINFGDQSYLDGIELSRADFYANLPGADPYPTTAAPAVGAFTQVYEDLTAAGATEILSIHLAASLSATYNAARLGAESANAAPVTVFDSEQITMGTGLLVILAAEAAHNGRSLTEIVTMLHDRVARTRVFGMIENLEALRRSGRVNWATFGIGTLLRIRPIMMVWQGDISVIDKVRTSSRAVSHMIETVRSFGPLEKLAVLHVSAPEAAERLCQQAQTLFPDRQPALTVEITPAIGTHLGIGAIGFACITKQDEAAR